jgi:predicted DNA-binding protein (UPF0251 family)
LKLNYTKSEINKFKEEIYFTEDELEALEYWMLDYSLNKMADKMHLSTRTISRRKRSILDKINRAVK